MPTSIVEITTHTHFPIKLTSTNFPVWRKQVLSTLIGLDLDQYVDGKTKPPPKTLEGKENPAYNLWYRQDQILLGALLGSCSDTIQPIVSSAETAHQVFKCLTDSYASVSRSRIISLKSKLAKNPKGAKPMAEFLHEMKGIADELALAQAPIDDEDLIVHILTQLGDDYKHITAALKVRDTPLTFSDLFAKLVDYERSLQETQPAPIIATVNQTQKQPSRYTGRTGYDSRNHTRSNNFGPRDNKSRTHNSGSNYNSRGFLTSQYYIHTHSPIL
ncbi:gag-polypeptide of LTR copia-type [Artemisia annua]|uniref:Gag-polypeptide of LTR copia-type n=1 Tax=Artemisia annua TaxID=35608 RepID=A0A2U1MSU6_ARTAN|nr:gag-polypeptide of LTR copia-type [Artemisia annua]